MAADDVQTASSIPRHTLLALVLLGIVVTFAIVVVIDAGQNTETAEPITITKATLQPAVMAQSACSPAIAWPPVAHNFVPYQQFTMRVIMQDGSPVQGLCITFLRDAVPVRPIEYVGACRTGQTGLCSLSVPIGLIRLYFDATEINGRSMDLSLNEIRPANTGRTDNLGYLIDEDYVTAEALLVVMPRGADHITIKSATRADDGTLTILNPDVPEWTQQRVE
jgi:hypothetical protein